MKYKACTAKQMESRTFKEEKFCKKIMCRVQKNLMQHFMVHLSDMTMLASNLL